MVEIMPRLPRFLHKGSFDIRREKAKQQIKKFHASMRPWKEGYKEGFFPSKNNIIISPIRYESMLYDAGYYYGRSRFFLEKLMDYSNGSTTKEFPKKDVEHYLLNLFNYNSTILRILRKYDFTLGTYLLFSSQHVDVYKLDKKHKEKGLEMILIYALNEIGKYDSMRVVLDVVFLPLHFMGNLFRSIHVSQETLKKLPMKPSFKGVLYSFD